MRLRGPAIVVLALGIGLAGFSLNSRAPASADGPPGLRKPPIVSAELLPGRFNFLDWGAAQKDISSFPECLGRPIESCVLVHGTGERVLLMGDSLARMWLPAFVRIAKAKNLTLAVAIHPSCPWPENLGGLGISPDCSPRREDWYRRVIPAFGPQIVFLANRHYDAPGNVLPMAVNGKNISASDPLAVQTIKQFTARSLVLLRRPGRELVILEPTPLPESINYDPMLCVATGSTQCSFSVSPHATALTMVDRDLAGAPDVWSVDLDRLACPRFPVCDSIVDGMIVRRDHTHLTATYTRGSGPARDDPARAAHPAVTQQLRLVALPREAPGDQRNQQPEPGVAEVIDELARPAVEDAHRAEAGIGVERECHSAAARNDRPDAAERGQPEREAGGGPFEQHREHDPDGAAEHEQDSPGLRQQLKLEPPVIGARETLSVAEANGGVDLGAGDREEESHPDHRGNVEALLLHASLQPLDAGAAGIGHALSR